jgi:PleD family two-component response regulator
LILREFGNWQLGNEENLTHLREKFASTALPANRFSRPKSNGNDVIVVDDENAVCQIVQRMLSDEQYQVQTSQSVADAVRAIEQSLLPPM